MLARLRLSCNPDNTIEARRHDNNGRKPAAGNNIMEHQTVLIRKEAPVGWMVMNRPQVRNALNLATWRAIAEGVAELEADPDIRVLIIRGVSNEAFISGADISEFKELRSDAEKARAYREWPNRAIAALTGCNKPIIAMIAGVCVGGGVQVALSCDIRIVARGTRFGIPAARLGLAYPLDGVLALTQITGPANAREILMSGRLFDAEEALAMGLIHKLVGLEELEGFVRQYAEQMAHNAPLTMAAAKACIREALKDPAQRNQKLVEEMVARCFNSEDYREGVRAFAEKRRPRFSGR
jgi:enoyl-CoA hydratase